MSVLDESISDALYWKTQARILRDGMRNILTQIHAGTPTSAIYHETCRVLKQAQATKYRED